MRIRCSGDVSEETGSALPKPTVDGFVVGLWIDVCVLRQLQNDFSYIFHDYNERRYPIKILSSLSTAMLEHSNVVFAVAWELKE